MAGMAQSFADALRQTEESQDPEPLVRLFAEHAELRNLAISERGVEGGWPGANPKDAEFFRRARTELDLRVAQLAAFGSGRRKAAES